MATGIIRNILQNIANVDLGSFASLSALETALTNLIPLINTGSTRSFIFSNSANLGSPFPNITGGWSGTIQPRAVSNNNTNSALIHIWNQQGYTIIGFNNNGVFTWYLDGFNGSTIKTTVSKTMSDNTVSPTISSNTSMDDAMLTLLNNDRSIYYGMSTWSFWNTSNLNKIGAVIPARKWFWFNGKLSRALTDIAKDATMTLNTNYQQKALLDSLGTAESIYVGDTNDGSTKNLTYNVQRYRYVVIVFKTNYEYDFMLIPISQLTINAQYIKSMMGNSSTSSGLVSDFDLKSTAIVTFLSYSSFKCIAIYTNQNWSLKVHRIIGIY